MNISMAITTMTGTPGVMCAQVQGVQDGSGRYGSNNSGEEDGSAEEWHSCDSSKLN